MRRAWLLVLIPAGILAWGITAELTGRCGMRPWARCPGSAEASEAPADHAAGGADPGPEAAPAEWDEALRPEQALTALRQEFEDRWGAAASLGSLGRLYARLGDEGRAERTVEKCLETMDPLGDRSGAAWLLCEFDSVAPTANRPEVTRTRVKDARRRAEELERARRTVQMHHDRGRAHLRAGEPKLAMRVAAEAAQALLQLVRSLGEEPGASLCEDWRFVFDLGLDAAVALEDPERAYHFLEAGRAVGFLQGVCARPALQSAGLAPVLREADLWARVRENAAAQSLARARERGVRKGIRKARDDFDAARRTRRQVADRLLGDAKKEAGSAGLQPATLEELRASLAADEVIVLYGLLGREARALVVMQEGARLVDLGPTRAVEDAVAGLDLNNAEIDPGDALERLRQRVVQPLRLPGGLEHVYVSPQGRLSDVPFSLLIPESEVALVPSASAHVRLANEVREPGTGVLALGDPLYAGGEGIPPLAVPGGGPTLHPLPHSRAEVECIGTTVLVGACASESGLREQLAGGRRWRSLHLACHGFLDFERPRLSALALTPTMEDDGLLTAMDVVGLDVPADLVVLSGCDTGRGKVYCGEGVLGLTRAFLFAGAAAVVVSLWPVDDAATRRLMTVLYERWAGGQGVADALRAAQEAVKADKRWTHPRYWAAWVLWGQAH